MCPRGDLLSQPVQVRRTDVRRSDVCSSVPCCVSQTGGRGSEEAHSTYNLYELFHNTEQSAQFIRCRDKQVFRLLSPQPQASVIESDQLYVPFRTLTWHSSLPPPGEFSRLHSFLPPPLCIAKQKQKYRPVPDVDTMHNGTITAKLTRPATARQLPHVSLTLPSIHNTQKQTARIPPTSRPRRAVHPLPARASRAECVPARDLLAQPW